MPASRITDITRADEPVVKRKYRSKEERRRIAEETLAIGASVAVIARAHGVNANQVFQWRKLYHEGRLDPATASTQLIDRKSTRLNSSHLGISYAVFCLKKQRKSGR